MNAKLLVILGNTTKREVALQLPAVLGRSRTADITVPHPLISRRHCEISENNGLLMVRDLTSLNGTMIGGRRIESAPLLPDAEFTIGPLLFRVLYEYDGDLESVPDTQFLSEAEGVIDAGLGDESPAETEEAQVVEELEEALPAPPDDANHAGEGQSDDVVELLVLADADAAEVVPVWPEPPGAAAGSQWPPVAVDKLPTVPLANSPGEPMEFDSSLQSGGHRTESPWGIDPPAVDKPRAVPPASAGKRPPPRRRTPPIEPETPPAAPETPLAEPGTPPDATAAEEAAKPTAKEKPTAARPTAAIPPKKPSYGEEIDPEFGSFLEGLQ